jgi:hypothetical protein
MASGTRRDELQDMIFLSTRQRFRRGDPGWDGYIQWIGLPQLSEVRTIDAKVNEDVDQCGRVYCERGEIDAVLEMLPVPSVGRQYYLLAAKVESESWAETFDGFVFVGCDLSDETTTSSVLNCGPWTGPLLPFVPRLNRYGLLSLDDAREVRSLLPLAWGAEEPHASADIWATFAQVA